ncbi:SDR family oxidoreductase [uncultured Pseudokineococcus sp.]|uniref:SDR family oxidoreductase n=1 Tax=uncultured Pseudokineococcus sp. TaxID=1642928 RepID=UPI0026240F26|nr:SDR family oxidoreductase [uncultured Pseudokineococcus sp.]
MKIAGSVALVTGANRGIGRALAAALLEQGAAKVYAGARDPRQVDLPGAQALALDITDPASVAAAAAVAADVTLVVNNAGVSRYQGLLDGDPDGLRAELDTHLWGTLAVTRATAPALARNGGGALVNVLSVLSWTSTLGVTSYSVAKAAQWALTNGLRLELAAQHTHVLGVHLGAADTDLMRDYDVPKLDPADVASATLAGLEARDLEVLVDDAARYVKAALARDPRELYGPHLTA